MEKQKFTTREKSWTLYDVACSAFSLILTAIIPLYVKAIGTGAGFTDAETTTQWAYIQSIGTLVVALLAPILGSMADYKGKKKMFFNFFFFMSIISLFAMAVFDNYIALLAINLIAAIGYAGSNIFYDAFLVDITDDSRMDYISSFGFGIGYIGSCVPFIVSILLITMEPFGLTGTAPIKISFAINAVWWLLFTIPFLRHVDQRFGKEDKPKHLIIQSFKHVLVTLKVIAKDKTVGLFLLAYFFYIDGVDTIIKMSTSFGKDVGIDNNQMIFALLATQIVAFPAVILMAKLAKKVSAKLIILISIGIYVGICIFGYFLQFSWQFWVLAIAVAIVQGTIQALSRSYFGRMIPNKDNSNEYFGFFNILGRYAAILGPFLMGFFTQMTGNSRNGVLSIAILFVLGFIVFLFVPNIDKKAKE